MKFAIVGGGGYVGHKLGSTLKSRGDQVVLFDLRYPTHLNLDGFHVVVANILEKERLTDSFAGCDGVFHLAAYGMTGREASNDSLITAVNVQGTQNVVAACITAKVARLVYASTTDVVWCDTLLHEGNEADMAYLAEERHVDSYGRTKAHAEQLILSANGTRLGNGLALHTCALRFHGIYGAQEIRITQRILESVRDGLCVARFDREGTRSMIQYVSGENCIQAMIKASQRLDKTFDHIAAGEAYFIMDAVPVDAFEFWRPIFEHFDRPLPYIRLPFTFMFYIAHIMEIASWYFNFEPLLTRKEVNHSAVTHWFSIDKAREQLDYRPEPPNFEAIINDYKERVEPQYLLKKAHRQSYTFVRLFAVCCVVFLFWLLTM